MGIIIRKLEEGELHLANDFFNRIYKTHRSYESFRWEFIEGPVGPAIYVAAFDDDAVEGPKVVGIQCAIPLNMVTDAGEVVLTAKSEDTLVDPDYRGFDVFNKMYTLLFSLCEAHSIRFIWGFTPAYKPFVKLGFDMEVKCSQMIYTVRPIPAYRYLASLNKANRLWDKVKIFGLCALGFSQALLKFRSGYSSQGIRFREGDFSSLALPAASSSGTRDTIALHEDHGFVKWRIHHNPHGNRYRQLVFVEDGNKELGSVVINVRSNIGFLEQISFMPGLDRQHQKSIVKMAISELKNQGVALVRFLSTAGNPSNASEIQLLKELGFLLVKRGSWFVWKGIGHHPPFSSRQVVLNRLYTQGIM